MRHHRLERASSHDDPAEFLDEPSDLVYVLHEMGRKHQRHRGARKKCKNFENVADHINIVMINQVDADVIGPTLTGAATEIQLGSTQVVQDPALVDNSGHSTLMDAKLLDPSLQLPRLNRHRDLGIYGTLASLNRPFEEFGD